MSELFNKSKSGGGNPADWRAVWDKVEAAADYEALPSGLYEAEPTKVEQFAAKSGTEGLKITWRVLSGEYQGRRVWQDCWLSQAALPFTKRVLAELRMASPDSPLPDGIACAIQVAQRTNDNGTAYNEVKRVKFLRLDANPFAPEPEPEQPDSPDAVPTASELVDSPAKQPAAPCPPSPEAVGQPAAGQQQAAATLPVLDMSRPDYDKRWFADLRAYQQAAKQEGGTADV